ncbi:MAG: AsmA family protein [Ignavibacteriae bacterium]|nr:AsmA family protein [Ignavibacteriota bacterium]MCB9260201.1 AsmA family protein [Ignavibacteriales bacterium]
MKKLLKVFGILFVLILVAMIVLPFLFKDQITQVVKDATNNSVNATVDFSDVDLSLFSSFPNLAVNINNLSIVNNAPFEGDTLLNSKSIGVSVDIMSLINGSVLKIESISLDSPKLIMYVLEDGRSNYNIAKESVEEEKSVQAETAQSNFNISLKNYSISNAQVALIDQQSKMLVALSNLNHSGKGDFTQDDFVLDTDTKIDELTFEFGGIKYLNKVKTALDMQLGINFPNNKFTLQDNSLALNNLILNFEGSIAMPGNDIDLDLKFNSPRSDFKDIISLIPAIYKNDFSNIQSSGKMEVAGLIKGKMTETKLPAFNLDLKVADGNFKYPDLPTPINNVQLNLNVNNPDGVIDHTKIDLSKIHIELDKEPIDGKLVVTNIETGPNIDTKIVGKIDLANIKTALDLKDIEKLEGIINSNFEASGNIVSAQKNYEEVNAKGNISVSNFNYKGNNFDQNVNISNASMEFTPKNINLNSFTAKIGESDIKANGTLKNLISFVLSDGILVGDLNLTSNFFDFNPYMTATEETTSQESTSTETAAFDVPKNINFNLSSRFNKLLYDNLELTNVTGNISIKNNKISLDNLNMNLLQGSLSGNGFYTKTEFDENPKIEFNLGIKDFNVKETYDKFVSVKQFAPIAKYIQGSFSSNLKMNTTLDITMLPVWETFFSNGSLNLKSAEIKNFKPFTTVGSMLKLQELSNPKLENVNPKFEIKNGRFYLNPVKYKVANYDVVLSGSNGIDQSLDYVMEVDIPASNLKNQANSAISNLIGKNVSLVNANTIKVKALIGGTVDDPKVNTSAGDVVQNVASDVVEQVKEQIVDEAKAKLEAEKAAAEQKLKEEAKKKEEEAKKKLEEEAKKKLKKIFGFG